MPILFDARWLGTHGIGRFGAEVSSRCGFVPLDIPGKPLSLLDPLRIRRALSGHRVEHYFSPGYNPPLGKPCSFSFTIHDLMLLDLPQLRSAAKTGYFEWIVKPGIKNAAVVFTVSEYSRQRIIDWSDAPPDKVVCVGNGVDSHYCSDGARWAHPRPYVLYVGNQRAHKNVEALIDAFAASAARNEFDLLLSGRFSDSVAEKVRLNRIEQEVHSLGMVPEESLPSLYRGAHALVMPSKYEGFGLPLVEAMACGTPVLASDRTAIPEVCGEAALYFDPENLESMVGALDRLNDEALLSQLKSAGLERAREFRWDDVAQRVKLAIQTRR
ncbi:glycosyltransferase family 4 protein [Fluviibacter phosphoraccumulans]|uniref:glycosyltransferase family 4 protein n=1 Tax=Fluviibacter phosphoraccumulans TaxID=1751046 RepID=UPI0010B3AAF6|nr:glycosyltransferase family 1 protein [Fluviibacter phosphoraccumulans]BCA66183.1 glycosyl transferase family 1 [Fluviibacter phosphoraccumulans]